MFTQVATYHKSRYDAHMTPEKTPEEAHVKLRWHGFIMVSFGTFLATLDFSALIVALPPIARDFNASMADVEWVLVAYILTIGSLLLPFGRSGDQWGKNKMYKLGFALFIGSALLCTFSQTIYQLIGARILQGLGAAMYMSVGPAILVDSFPARQRGKVIGFMGTIVSLGLMMGAPIGGLLTEYFSWRSIFIVNIPIGILGILWGLYIFPKDNLSEKDYHFDYLGSFLCVCVSGSLLILLSRISIWGVTSSATLGFFLLLVVSGTLFIYVQKRNPFGVLDLNLFRNRVFTFGSISLLLHFISINVVYFLMPFYLSEVLSHSQKNVGFIMMAIPASFAIVNPISGWLSDKIGTHVLAPLGLFMSAGVYLMISNFEVTSSVPRIVFTLLLVGVSLGFFQAPNASAILGSVSHARLGTASAFISTMRNFGNTIGIALATMVFTFRVRAYDGYGSEFSVHELPPNLFMSAFHDTLIISVVVVIIATGVSILRGRT